MSNVMRNKVQPAETGVLAVPVERAPYNYQHPNPVSIVKTSTKPKEFMFGIPLHGKSF